MIRIPQDMDSALLKTAPGSNGGVGGPCDQGMRRTDESY